MVIAVLAYASSHIRNYDWANIHTLFYLTQAVGLSVDCTYLCLKWHFFWAVAAHSINNLLVLLLSFVPLYFAAGNYNLLMAPLYQTSYTTYSEENGSTVLRGEMSSNALSLSVGMERLSAVDPMNQRTFYFSQRNEGLSLNRRYVVTITPQVTPDPSDYKEIFNTLERKSLLRIDTTYENYMLLGMVDDGLRPEGLLNPSATIRDLIQHIIIYYQIPLIPADGLNCDYPIHIDYSKLRRMGSLKQCVAYIRQAYGLSLAESKKSKAQVITFKDR